MSLDQAAPWPLWLLWPLGAQTTLVHPNSSFENLVALLQPEPLDGTQIASPAPQLLRNVAECDFPDSWSFWLRLCKTVIFSLLSSLPGTSLAFHLLCLYPPSSVFLSHISFHFLKKKNPRAFGQAGSAGSSIHL